MKTIIFLATFILMNMGFAQHKILTLYYPGDSTNVVSITNLDSMVIFICGASKINYGGKDYNTVLIGTQCWLKENLDIGTMITSWPSNNGIIEKYCYNNNPTNCTTYGGLYMWEEAMQYVTNEGARGICPTGWHMPTLAEYQTLAETASNDGNSLKEIGQGTGTNTSGFSGLLAGAKGYSGGPYQGLGEWSAFWIGKTDNCGFGPCAYGLQIISNTSAINISGGGMTSWGFSVRCIKD